MVYCPKCGKKNPDNAFFCINCGTEIKKEELELEPKVTIVQPSKLTREYNVSIMNEKIKKSDHKKLSLYKVVIIFIALAIIAILFIPMISYSEVESYEREAKYRIISSNCELLISGWKGALHDDIIFNITIQNIDNFGGKFKVTGYLHLSFSDPPNSYRFIDKSGYIELGNTKEFSIMFEDTGYNSFFDTIIYDYNITPPSITDQKIVTKYKSIYESIF